MADGSSDDRLKRFRCREALWQVFEQMAIDLDCSVDFLVMDSMKKYARQHGYRVPIPSDRPSRDSSVSTVPPDVREAGRTDRVRPVAESPAAGLRAGSAEPRRTPSEPFALQRPSSRPAPAPTTVAPPKRALSAAAPPPLPPPPPPPRGSIGAGRPPPPPVPRSSISAPSRAGRPAPPAPPPSRGAVPAAAARTPLSIYYQGLRFPVDKERFVIGRGKTASDLVIKDPNVSRQHALVEWHDGHWYVVDMGSTNGFEVHGTRVQRRQVSAGDVITVCNHELEFVFE